MIKQDQSVTFIRGGPCGMFGVFLGLFVGVGEVWAKSYAALWIVITPFAELILTPIFIGTAIQGMLNTVVNTLVSISAPLQKLFGSFGTTSTIYNNTLGRTNLNSSIFPRDTPSIAVRAGAGYFNLIVISMVVLVATGLFIPPVVASDLWDITLIYLNDLNAWVVNVWDFLIYGFYNPANNIYQQFALIWNTAMSYLPSPIPLMLYFFNQTMRVVQLFIRGFSGNWGQCICGQTACFPSGASSCLAVDVRCFMTDMWDTILYFFQQILTWTLGPTSAVNAIRFLNALANAYFATLEALLPSANTCSGITYSLDVRIDAMIASIDAIYSSLGNDLVAVVVAFITNLPGIRDLINIVYSIPALIIGGVNAVKNIFLNKFRTLINTIMGYIIAPWRTLCGGIREIPFVGDDLASLPFCSLSNTIRTADDLFPDIGLPQLPAIPGLAARSVARTLLGYEESMARRGPHAPTWDDYVYHAGMYENIPIDHPCHTLLTDGNKTASTLACLFRAESHAAVQSHPELANPQSSMDNAMREMLLHTPNSLSPGQPDENLACHRALSDPFTHMVTGSFQDHTRTIHCAVAHAATAQIRTALVNTTWFSQSEVDAYVPHLGADIGKPHGEAGIVGFVFAHALKYYTRDQCEPGNALHLSKYCDKNLHAADHIHPDSAPPPPPPPPLRPSGLPPRPGDAPIYNYVSPELVHQIRALIRPNDHVPYMPATVKSPFPWVDGGSGSVRPQGRPDRPYAPVFQQAKPAKFTRRQTPVQQEHKSSSGLVRTINRQNVDQDISIKHPTTGRRMLQMTSTPDRSIRMFGTLEDDYYEFIREAGDGVIGALSVRLLQLLPETLAYITSLDIRRPSIGRDIYRFIKCDYSPSTLGQSYGYGILCLPRLYIFPSFPPISGFSPRLGLIELMYPAGTTYTNVSPVYQNYQHRYIRTGGSIMSIPTEPAIKCYTFFPSGGHVFAYFIEYALVTLSPIISIIRPNTDMHLHDLRTVISFVLPADLLYFTIVPAWTGSPFYTIWFAFTGPLDELVTIDDLSAPLSAFLSIYDPTVDGHSDFDTTPGVCSIVMSGSIPLNVLYLLVYLLIVVSIPVYFYRVASQVGPLLIELFRAPMGAILASTALTNELGMGAVHSRLLALEQRGRV